MTKLNHIIENKSVCVYVLRPVNKNKKWLQQHVTWAKTKKAGNPAYPFMSNDYQWFDPLDLYRIVFYCCDFKPCIGGLPEGQQQELSTCPTTSCQYDLCCTGNARLRPFDLLPWQQHSMREYEPEPPLYANGDFIQWPSPMPNVWG